MVDKFDMVLFKSFLDGLLHPALVLDEESRIVEANAPADELFETGLKGVGIVRILRQPIVHDCIAQARSDRNTVIESVILHRRTPRTYKIAAAPLDDKAGATKFILFTMMDVSSEIHAEKSRSTFVANVSHELRSPLTTLMGVVETLQGAAREDPKARDKFLGLMRGEIGRMSRLVGDLLSLSKLESKEHETPEGRVDIFRLLRRVESSLAASNPENIGRVKFDIPDNLPLLPGDIDELTEVFQNILENALKYSAAETDVDVHAALDMNNSAVIVSIQDRGDGIAPEHLPRLTERFYRVDKGRSRQMGGTGLGLAISKHILNRHRAKMGISSILGEGTDVKVTLRV